MKWVYSGIECEGTPEEFKTLTSTPEVKEQRIVSVRTRNYPKHSKRRTFKQWTKAETKLLKNALRMGLTDYQIQKQIFPHFDIKRIQKKIWQVSHRKHKHHKGDWSKNIKRLGWVNARSEELRRKNPSMTRRQALSMAHKEYGLGVR